MKLSQQRQVKRQAICLQLQANRKLLQRQIQSNQLFETEGYPRSLIMRAMAKQPALTVVLATEVLPLLLSQFLEWSARRRSKKPA